MINIEPPLFDNREQKMTQKTTIKIQNYKSLKSTILDLGPCTPLYFSEYDDLRDVIGAFMALEHRNSPVSYVTRLCHVLGVTVSKTYASANQMFWDMLYAPKNGDGRPTTLEIQTDGIPTLSLSIETETSEKESILIRDNQISEFFRTELVFSTKEGGEHTRWKTKTRVDGAGLYMYDVSDSDSKYVGSQRVSVFLSEKPQILKNIDSLTIQNRMPDLLSYVKEWNSKVTDVFSAAGDIFIRSDGRNTHSVPLGYFGTELKAVIPALTTALDAEPGDIVVLPDWLGRYREEDIELLTQQLKKIAIARNAFIIPLFWTTCV